MLAEPAEPSESALPILYLDCRSRDVTTPSRLALALHDLTKDISWLPMRPSTWLEVVATSIARIFAKLTKLKFTASMGPFSVESGDIFKVADPSDLNAIISAYEIFFERLKPRGVMPIIVIGA